MIDSLLQDLRFALRTLRQNPGFTTLAVLTLALGIGANTAIFSVISGVLLKPLPYEDGERLVLLKQEAPGVGRQTLPLSIKEVMDYRERLESFDGVVEYHSMSFTLLNRGEPDRVLTGVVSHNFFDVLGIEMLHGRTFVEADDRLGAEAVLVLSYPYWQQRFGGDPEIVGQVFEMNDKPHTVVGILPPIPQWPRDNDVYMPTVACPFRGAAQQNIETNRGAFRALTTFGKLAPGVGVERARSDVATVATQFAREFPETYTPESNFSATTVTLFEELTRNARSMLLILLATSGIVLLTACGNVANLMLARTMRRERELAVRAAMGAGRGRLLRQLLTESTLVAVAGGLLGLALAVFGIDMLAAFAARFTPRTQQIAVDGWVLAFTLGISVLTGLAFGLVPALSTRSGLAGTLKEGGGRSTDDAGKHRLRGALIVGQVALSFMLLIAAGLLLTSFWRLSQVDPGFETERVLAAEMFPNWSKYQTFEDRRRLYTGVLDQVRGIPGVLSVTIAQQLPLEGRRFGSGTQFTAEGIAEENPELLPRVWPQGISPGYFDTIGVPLLAGRTFTPADDADAPSVAIVNRTMARSVWGDADPVGSRIRLQGNQFWTTIVGVAGDVRHQAIDSEPTEELYLPLLQGGGGGRLLIRTAGEPMAIAAQVRDAVHAIDPEQPVENFRTLEQVRAGAMATPRLTSLLLGLFAGLALVITVAGIAGVVATTVGERTREFGIRMALGARSGSVLTMVLRQGLTMVGAGIGIGLAGALAFGGALAGMLYRTEPTDPLAFVAVALVFLLAGLGACAVPARRAISVDPIVALRRE